ncbi:MAG TPA: hypothetical protein ENN40_00485 [Candidatus Aminicenantes bacterium]|nr:hypothetical protein [Candidatus Aminicenantes bacterium]
MSHSTAKICLVLLVFTFAGVFQAQEATQSRDNLASIVTIPDPFVRMSALEDFYRSSLRDPEKSEIDRNLLLHLTDTAYQIRNFPLVLRYGEEGLARDWNNPRLKMALYFYVARACEEQGVNTGKALRYAAFIRELARVVDPTRADALIWKQFVAPAQRLSMRLLASRATNAKDWHSALQSGVFALELDANEEAGKELYETALRARLDEHGRAAAVAALQALCRSPLARPEYLNRLAFWHSQDERSDLAAELLITSHGMKRDPAVAYTIGKLLQKSRLKEALDYLAEAVQSGEGETVTRARRLLEHLFFNVHAADLSADEQEKEFARLMQAAAQRVREKKTKAATH